MKNILGALVFAVVAIMMCSCDQISQREIQLANQLDSVERLLNLKDSSMVLLASTMADVQQNLAAIKEHEKLITTAVSTDGRSAKEQIQNDLNQINDLLQANKKKVADLTAKLKKATQKNSEFESIIKLLEDQIAQQNEEIEKLKSILDDKNVEIGFLNNAVIKLSSAVDSTSQVAASALSNVASLTDAKNTAYYVVGSKSELKEKGITTSAGLFSKKVSGDADNSLFTKINWTEVTSIPTNCKRIKIISSHDENSYVEEKGSDGLITIQIKNKESFWKVSKYLVIQGREQED
ncbi:MAG: hypothetical protein MJZ27_07590 [Bacteroidales bacterium]|nr:hypothetical protein [Bacteroidales bacterium]